MVGLTTEVSDLERKLLKNLAECLAGFIKWMKEMTMYFDLFFFC